MGMKIFSKNKKKYNKIEYKKLFSKTNIQTFKVYTKINSDPKMQNRYNFENEKSQIEEKMVPLFRTLVFEKWFLSVLFDIRRNTNECIENLINFDCKTKHFQRYLQITREFVGLCSKHFQDLMDYENFGPFHEGMRWNYNNHLTEIIRVLLVNIVVQITQSYYKIIFCSKDVFDQTNTDKLRETMEVIFEFIFRLENEFEEYRIRKQSRYFPYMIGKANNWINIDMDRELLELVSYESSVDKEFLKYFHRLQRKMIRENNMDYISDSESECESECESEY